MLEGLTGLNIKESTIGVIGTGVRFPWWYSTVFLTWARSCIYQQIGLLAGGILSHGFGARVLGYDAKPNEKGAAEHGIKYCSSLEELLPQCDIITIHCPLLPSTKHMINEDTISQMKNGVIIVNTSRGGLVKTDALVKGLKEGKIQAAGLDVYENENEYLFQESHASLMKVRRLSVFRPKKRLNLIVNRMIS